MKKNEAASPAVKPEAPASVPKTCETSPYFFAAELLLERKFTDDEIFQKVQERFQGTTYSRGEISVCRSDMNRTGYRSFPKVEKPIIRIKPAKVEKPASESKKAVVAPKETQEKGKPQTKAPATPEKGKKTPAPVQKKASPAPAPAKKSFRKKSK